MEAPPGATAPDPGGPPPTSGGQDAPPSEAAGAEAAVAPEAPDDGPALAAPGAAGGHPPPSPLSGGYLLIVIGEPHSAEHRDLILQRIAKGFLSWDSSDCHVELEKELSTLSSLAPKGEEARNGERLVQYASESLVTEVLVHPQVNTLLQCVRNLLSSFTRHRHILHAGYTFAGTGSWILQDGTFSYADLAELFHEPDVQRVLRAYENSVSVDVHCCAEGPWRDASAAEQPFSRFCRVRVNPPDVLTAGSPAINGFIDYVGDFVRPAVLESLMEPSDVVGNIRFSHPTLYVFPGGQGDAALFGINGFNMLVDGGFGRKSCFWDFARHLDRLDAVLLTRLNNANAHGLASLLRRKRNAHVYPQIGHFFCNLQDRKVLTSPDGDKDRDNLLVSLVEEGQEMVLNLRHLQLKPSPCYRDSVVEPVNLYHKVGHGKLDMYVVSPARDSKEVKEFLARWTANDSKLFASHIKKDSRDFQFPLQNMVSICALLVWQPANPQDTITRILFPGSTPQVKIFEGLEKLRHLEYLKHPTCTAKSLSPSPSVVGLSAKAQIKKYTPTVIDKITPGEQKTYTRTVPTTETSKHHVLKTATIPIAGSNSEAKVYKSGTTTVSSAISKAQSISKKTEKVTKSEVDNQEKSEKDAAVKENKLEEIQSNMVKEEKRKGQEISKVRSKPRQSSKSRERKTVNAQSIEKKQVEKKEKKDEKPSPTTPKKVLEVKVNGVSSRSDSVTRVSDRSTSKTRRSPLSTPAKSAKEANNRKVAESKTQSTRATSVTRTTLAKPSKKEDTADTKPKAIEKQAVPKRSKPVSPSKPAKSQGSPVKTQTKVVTSKVLSIRKSRATEKDGSIAKEVQKVADKSPESSVNEDSSVPAESDKNYVKKEEMEVYPGIVVQDTNVLKEQKQEEQIETTVENNSTIEDADEKKSEVEEITPLDDPVEPDEEEDEYLVIEKEEPYTEESCQDQVSAESHAPVCLENRALSDEDDGEDEKLKRDTQESEKVKDKSEKPRKKSEPKLTMQLTDKEHAEQIAKTSVDEVTAFERKPILHSETTALHLPCDSVKEQLVEEVQEIITSAAEIISKRDDKILPVEPKSDEKGRDNADDDLRAKDGKLASVEHKEESQPDEKMSTTAESGATTAPTLPEDERIPLDEIKEVVEEKHAVEDTKEKDNLRSREEELNAGHPGRPDHFQINKANVPVLHRDMIKTPDEVADLPVDEEYEPALYSKEEQTKVSAGESSTSRRESAVDDPVDNTELAARESLTSPAVQDVDNNKPDRMQPTTKTHVDETKDKQSIATASKDGEDAEKALKESSETQIDTPVEETKTTEHVLTLQEEQEKANDQEKDIDTKEHLLTENTTVEPCVSGLKLNDKGDICVSLEELRILGHQVEDIKLSEITREDAKYSNIEPSDLLEAEVLKQLGTKPKTIVLSSVSKDTSHGADNDVVLNDETQNDPSPVLGIVALPEPLESVQEDVYLEGSVEEEPVYGKTDAPTHPEYVTVTPDSSPEWSKSPSGKRQSITGKAESRKSSLTKDITKIDTEQSRNEKQELNDKEDLVISLSGQKLAEAEEKNQTTMTFLLSGAKETNAETLSDNVADEIETFASATCSETGLTAAIASINLEFGSQSEKAEQVEFVENVDESGLSLPTSITGVDKEVYQHTDIITPKHDKNDAELQKDASFEQTSMPQSFDNMSVMDDAKVQTWENDSRIPPLLNESHQIEKHGIDDISVLQENAPKEIINREKEVLIESQLNQQTCSEFTPVKVVDNIEAAKDLNLESPVSSSLPQKETTSTLQRDKLSAPASIEDHKPIISPSQEFHGACEEKGSTDELVLSNGATESQEATECYTPKASEISTPTSPTKPSLAATQLASSQEMTSTPTSPVPSPTRKSQSPEDLVKCPTVSPTKRSLQSSPVPSVESPKSSPTQTKLTAISLDQITPSNITPETSPVAPNLSPSASPTKLTAQAMSPDLTHEKPAIFAEIAALSAAENVSSNYSELPAKQKSPESMPTKNILAVISVTKQSDCTVTVPQNEAQSSPICESDGTKRGNADLDSEKDSDSKPPGESELSAERKSISESPISSPTRTSVRTISPVSASPELTSSKQSSVEHVGAYGPEDVQKSCATDKVKAQIIVCAAELSSTQSELLSGQNTEKCNKTIQSIQKSLQDESRAQEESEDTTVFSGNKDTAESTKLQKEAEDSEKSISMQVSPKSASEIVVVDQELLRDGDVCSQTEKDIGNEIKEFVHGQDMVPLDLNIDRNASVTDDERRSGATTPSIFVTGCRDLARQSQPSESDTDMPDEDNQKRQDDVFEAPTTAVSLTEVVKQSPDTSPKKEHEGKCITKDRFPSSPEFTDKEDDKSQENIREIDEKADSEAQIQKQIVVNAGILNKDDTLNLLAASQEFLDAETLGHTDNFSEAEKLLSDVAHPEVREIALITPSAVSTAISTMNVEKIEAATSPMTPFEPLERGAKEPHDADSKTSSLFHLTQNIAKESLPMSEKDNLICETDTKKVLTGNLTAQDGTASVVKGDQKDLSHETAVDVTENIKKDKEILHTLVSSGSKEESQVSKTPTDKQEPEVDEPEFKLVSKSVHEEYVSVPSDENDGDCKKLAATTTISTFTAKDVSDSPKQGDITKTVTTVTKMTTGADGLDAVETTTTEKVQSDGKITTLSTKTESSPLHKRSSPEPDLEQPVNSLTDLDAICQTLPGVSKAHQENTPLTLSETADTETSKDTLLNITNNATGLDKTFASGISAISSDADVHKDSRDATRSCTPGSDIDMEPSTPHSDISSGQVSRAPTHASEGDYQHESEDEDVPGSPTSLTSQVTHSPPPPHFDFDIGDPHRTVSGGSLGARDDQFMLDTTSSSSSSSSYLRRQTIADPMACSIYGEVSEDPLEEMVKKIEEEDPIKSSIYVTSASEDTVVTVPDNTTSSELSASVFGELAGAQTVGFDRAVEEHRVARGSDLTRSTEGLLSTTGESLKSTPDQREQQIIDASFNKQAFDSIHPVQDQPNQASAKEMATPGGTLDDISAHVPKTAIQEVTAKDPIESWGKPLGLPSPVPPPTLCEEHVPSPKSTPQKDKLGARKVATDNKKRPESPRKSNKFHKGNPIYIDLTYVPHHGNSYYTSLEFFKRVRARYYVFSGIEPSREVYNALLEAKQSWEDKDLEVTIIPTYDTDTLGYWVAENEDALAKYKIDLSPSASRCTINLQDHETSCSAYRLEF